MKVFPFWCCLYWLQISEKKFCRSSYLCSIFFGPDTFKIFSFFPLVFNNLIMSWHFFCLGFIELLGSMGLWQWFSNRGDFLLPISLQGCLTMFGAIWGCHKLVVLLASLELLHPSMFRTTLHNKELCTPKCQRCRGRKTLVYYFQLSFTKFFCLLSFAFSLLSARALIFCSVFLGCFIFISFICYIFKFTELFLHSV